MKKVNIDWYILVPVLLLLSLGLIMVLSASSAVASSSAKYGNNPYYFFYKQIKWAGVGIVALIFGVNYKYHYFKKHINKITGGIFFLLIVVLIPGLADVRNGASSWIHLGSMSFQPSEFVKLGTIIILAYVLVNKRKIIGDFQNGLLPPLMITATICILIILERDLGTTMALAFVAFALFFLAGARILHLMMMAGFGFSAACLAIYIADYRVGRILAFINPWSDPTGIGWQIIQSLYAIASGGLVGVGIGHSRQKFLWLPESYTDFIYSIVAEELGFIGSVFIIILFVLLIGRGFIIAKNIQDPFGSLVASGITTMIAVEAIMNIAAATNAMPVTGITLPFISYGGSSLVIKMLSIGILMNISKYAKPKVNKERTKGLVTN